MDKPGSNKLRAASVLVGLAAVALVLYFFPPGEFRFYPRCWLYATTGLQCPGCGGLRAMHQLLHGHFTAAFQLNPLFVTLLPLLGWFVVAYFVRRATGRDWLRPLRRPSLLWLLLAVVVAFSIVRNLPPLSVL